MKKETITIELSEKEYDLIQAIRNYRKSYIFSSLEIIFHIEKLFTELMDGEEWIIKISIYHGNNDP